MSATDNTPVAHYHPDPIPGIIPFGTVTLFAGAPGVGKTAMLAEWCRRWRDGLTICGHQTNRPTGFYFIAADRQWASHQLWFDAVGFSDIPRYSIADDPTYRLEDLQFPEKAHKCFLSALDKLAPLPGGHVFVDPVSPLFIGGNPNRARDVASTMLRFSRVSSDRQINLTCTAHFSKQKSDPKELYQRPQDRIAGSGAFAGFTDTQIYLIDPIPKEQPYHILGWVPRHAPPAQFPFTRDAFGLFVPYEGLMAEAKDAKQDRPSQLYLLIPEEGIDTGDLEERAEEILKISRATVHRDLKKLLERKLIKRDQWGFITRRKVN